MAGTNIPVVTQFDAASGTITTANLRLESMQTVLATTLRITTSGGPCWGEIVAFDLNMGKTYLVFDNGPLYTSPSGMGEYITWQGEFTNQTPYSIVIQAGVLQQTTGTINMTFTVVLVRP